MIAGDVAEVNSDLVVREKNAWRLFVCLAYGLFELARVLVRFNHVAPSVAPELDNLLVQIGLRFAFRDE